VVLQSNWGVALEPTINSRENTPAEDSQSDTEEEASAVDRLVVPFEKLLAFDNLERATAGHGPDFISCPSGAPRNERNQRQAGKSTTDPRIHTHTNAYL